MTATLIAEEGILKGLVLALEDREEWVVGRDPDLCDIVLEDPQTSRTHFRIHKREEQYFLENLSVTNPVEINDKRISGEMPIVEGDKITIGGSVFRFYKERLISLEEQRLQNQEMLFSQGQETIFKEEEIRELPEKPLELRIESRFILKVIGGPNMGAEYALEPGREYLIGSDTTTCDIFFNDLSVSSEHARLFLDHEGRMFIEDIDSRNGVIVDKEKIEEKRVLLPHTQVTLGTSVFLVIDREAPSMTLLSPPEEEAIEQEEQVEVKVEKPQTASFPASILVVILAGLVILLGLGVISLFQEKQIHVISQNHEEEIRQAIAKFPSVQFTYSEITGRLFLTGHVLTATDKQALIYDLQALSFIHCVEDIVVTDDAIWQEMNLLLSKYKEFEGVSMHASEPGKFVLSGYLKTAKQKALLMDYMNLNFLYLNFLQDDVIVEEQVIEEVKKALAQSGFMAVTVDFINGQLTLIGYASAQKSEEFQALAKSFSSLQGTKQVRNFVVYLSPEQAVVDLNERYPNRYLVTGYSIRSTKECKDINFNVVINGRILMRGNAIDGMEITSIQPHTVFFEKDGLKYKLEYNK